MLIHRKIKVLSHFVTDFKKLTAIVISSYCSWHNVE